MRDTYFYCHGILPTVSSIVDLFPVSSGVWGFREDIKGTGPNSVDQADRQVDQADRQVDQADR